MVGTGEKIKGVKASELSDQPALVRDAIEEAKAEKKAKPKKTNSKMVAFTKKGKTDKFEFESDDYFPFIKDKGLNEAMVKNCLDGVVKTHKGYSIKFI